MIPAKKHIAFSRWFAAHARTRIGRTFGRVLVSGLPELRASCNDGPVLLVANHTAWWDPLVALWLSALVLDADAYAMMDAKNLRKLPFFGLVGAFGVDLSHSSDGAQAIRYAARLLDRKKRIVWIYPEGKESSPFAPLELRQGAAVVERVARRAHVGAVSVRYVFSGREQPDLWIAISPVRPRERDADIALSLQRDAIADGLRKIDDALAAGDAAGFEVLLERRPSAIERLAERALVRIVRWFFG
jgi:hypothetical protein